MELSARALDPGIKVIAPAREWDLPAAKRSIRASAAFRCPRRPGTVRYSIDVNLWGRSIECGPLDDPWEEPPEDVYT